MKLKLSASVIIMGALSLAGCSSPSASSHEAFVPAVEVAPPAPTTEAQISRQNDLLETEADTSAPTRDGGFHRDLDGDDYRAVEGSTLYSNKPGWKGQRQLEKEKIHRLAKLCIAAKNTSPPCNDIVQTNARMGKFYILQESEDMSPYLKKWNP